MYRKKQTVLGLLSRMATKSNQPLNEPLRSSAIHLNSQYLSSVHDSCQQAEPSEFGSTLATLSF